MLVSRLSQLKAVAVSFIVSCLRRSGQRMHMHVRDCKADDQHAAHGLEFLVETAKEWAGLDKDGIYPARHLT